MKGTEGFVAMKTMDATLVANVKQYAIMRAIQDEEFQELHEIIEYKNDRQERLLSTLKREQKLMGDVLELREHSCHQIRVLDDRISAEEVELLERKQVMRKGGELKWKG